MSRNRTPYFDCARVLAIISISLNHAVNRPFDNAIDTQAEFQAMTWGVQCIKAVVSVFSRLGVPIFIMLTGALFLSRSFKTESEVIHFYRHNWLRLLVAVEIWLAIYFWFIFFAALRELSHEDLILSFVSTLLFINQQTEPLMWYMGMIIPLYTLIPVLSVFINKGYFKYLRLPVLFAFFVPVIAYDYQRHLSMTYPEESFVTALQSPISFFVGIVIVGYYISNGGLSKIPTVLICAINLGLFTAATRYQLWLYASPYNTLVAYDSVLLLLCSFTVFELIRRADGKIMHFFSNALAHLSKRCLGLYFVHIIIMEWICWHFDFSNISPLEKMLILESFSLGGALIVVELLGVIKPVKKYLFIIK